MTSPYSTYLFQNDYARQMQSVRHTGMFPQSNEHIFNHFYLPSALSQLQYFEASSNFLKQAQNGSNFRGISDLAKSGQVATRHLSKLQPLQQPAPHWSVGPAVAVGPVGPVGFEPWEITVQQGEVYKYGKLNDPSYINYIIHHYLPK